MKTLPVKNKPFKEAKKMVKSRWLSGYYSEFMESIVASEEYADKLMADPDFCPRTDSIPRRGRRRSFSVADGYYLWKRGKYVGVVDSYGRQIISPDLQQHRLSAQGAHIRGRGSGHFRRQTCRRAHQPRRRVDYTRRVRVGGQIQRRCGHGLRGRLYNEGRR